MRSALAPMRLARFRRLLAAYSVNAAGNWLGEIALSVLVLHETRSVAAVTALWVAALIVPGLAAPLVVSALEARTRRDALPALLGTEALLFAAVAILAAGAAPFAAVLLIALQDGLLAAAARALLKASIVHTSRPAGLHEEANALVNGAFMTSAAVGPAAAGVVVAAAGVPCALLVDATSFAIAAVLLVGRHGAVAAAPTAGGGSALSGLRRALAHVRGHASLRSLLLADAMASIFFSLIIPVEIAFVTGTLGGSASDYGAVLAAWGAGAVAGSVVAPALRSRPVAQVVLGSFVVMGISYLGMGAATSIAPVIGFSFFGGIGNGVEAMALVTAIQARAGDHLQAQVNGLIEAIHSAGPGAGFVLGGAIAATASPRAAYLVAAGGALAVVIVAARALLPARPVRQAAPAPATG